MPRRKPRTYTVAICNKPGHNQGSMRYRSVLTNGMDSRGMSLGSVPHRTLHLLPLVRAQKKRSRQRDVQFARYVRVRVRAVPEQMYVDTRPRVRVRATPPRNVHCALDDASERTAHRDRYVNICGPLTIDVWCRARAALVL
jgi:hypothetical protein